MICQVKPIKNRLTKTSSIDKAFALPARPAQPEQVDWSPILAGPFIVPVSRWVE
jgi:hypothetical protein